MAADARQAGPPGRERLIAGLQRAFDMALLDVAKAADLLGK